MGRRRHTNRRRSGSFEWPRDLAWIAICVVLAGGGGAYVGYAGSQPPHPYMQNGVPIWIGGKP
jgi:hypothetical protein